MTAAYFERGNGQRVSVDYTKANNMVVAKMVDIVMRSRDVLVIRAKNGKRNVPAIKPVRFGGNTNAFSMVGADPNGARVMGMSRRRGKADPGTSSHAN